MELLEQGWFWRTWPSTQSQHSKPPQRAARRMHVDLWLVHGTRSPVGRHHLVAIPSWNASILWIWTLMSWAAHVSTNNLDGESLCALLYMEERKWHPTSKWIGLLGHHGNLKTKAWAKPDFSKSCNFFKGKGVGGLNKTQNRCYLV